MMMMLKKGLLWRGKRKLETILILLIFGRLIIGMELQILKTKFQIYLNLKPHKKSWKKSLITITITKMIRLINPKKTKLMNLQNLLVPKPALWRGISNRGISFQILKSLYSKIITIKQLNIEMKYKRF